MKNKVLLYTGILLLTTGIVLNLFAIHNILAWLFITSGGLCKLSYLILELRSGDYKAGYELLFLALGLLFLFTAKYAKFDFVVQYAIVFTIVGILLKTAFVVLFIRKVAKIRKVRINRDVE